MARPGLPAGLSFAQPTTFLATGAGLGLLPKTPGTWGSLGALPLAWAAVLWGGPALAAALGAGLFALGVWASNAVLARGGGSDPGYIVIDEIAAQILVLAVAPLAPLPYLAGFVLFRLFDIAKPWPVGWADRAVKGGLGVMLDDLLAAAYAAAILYAALALGAL